MKYRLKASKHFKRVYSKKPQKMRAAIDRCLSLLASDPRYPGLQAHKMRGRDGVWEAYVDKGNRITFEYDKDDPQVIQLLNNCNHDMLYRNPAP